MFLGVSWCFSARPRIPRQSRETRQNRLGFAKNRLGFAKNRPGLSLSPSREGCIFVVFCFFFVYKKHHKKHMKKHHKKQETGSAQGRKRPPKKEMSGRGFEPPTQGFSVPCSNQLSYPNPRLCREELGRFWRVSRLCRESPGVFRRFSAKPRIAENSLYDSRGLPLLVERTSFY